MNTVQTKDAPSAIGPYSQAVVSGGFLYTAGQIGLDPATMQVVTGDAAAQATQALKNLTAVLAAAGATWNDVVKTSVFLLDMNDFAKVNEVYSVALGNARPARTTVAVSGLPRGALVEIDAVAKLP
jgi:2-iminobutanoate/2-iminopropanoate deaminase